MPPFICIPLSEASAAEENIILYSGEFLSPPQCRAMTCSRTSLIARAGALLSQRSVSVLSIVYAPLELRRSGSFLPSSRSKSAVRGLPCGAKYHSGVSGGAGSGTSGQASSVSSLMSSLLEPSFSL